jgi:hypothetical protein
MNEDEREFKQIEYRHLLFQTGDRYVVMGRDFLGVNGREVESCSLFQGDQERSIRIGGEETRIRVDSKIVHGPITTYINLRVVRGPKGAEEPPTTFKKIMGMVVEYRNWPLMLFKSKEILISQQVRDRMRFLCFDRVPPRQVNKPLKKLSGYEDPYPRVAWSHLYQDGLDRIKLVYLDYLRAVWESVDVVDGRQYIDNKITPGDPQMISLLRPSRLNGAAELWVYRNGKRTQSLIFDNYVRRRDRNYRFSGYKSQDI